MTDSASPSPASDTTRQPGHDLKALAGAALAGFAAVTATATMLRGASSSKRAQQKTRAQRTALIAYLTDHLTGSEAAFRLVGQRRATDAGTPLGELFADLHEEFQTERSIVKATLRSLGASDASPTRVLGKAAGRVLQSAVGDATDELSLFRMLEALAIGVQGKRLLWRALQDLAPDSATSQRFENLEALALDQWGRLEHHRRDLAAGTFGSLHP